MIINKVANADDVLNESGLTGWEAAMHNSLPREAAKSSSGSGSVSPNQRGADVSGEATAGGTAALLGWDARRAYGTFVCKTKIVYSASNGSSTSDTVELGWTTSGVGSNTGVYLDIANGQYNANGTTKPASIPTAN